jgi:hypothetical protein
VDDFRRETDVTAFQWVVALELLVLILLVYSIGRQLVWMTGPLEDIRAYVRRR